MEVQKKEGRGFFQSRSEMGSPPARSLLMLSLISSPPERGASIIRPSWKDYRVDRVQGHYTKSAGLLQVGLLGARK